VSERERVINLLRIIRDMLHRKVNGKKEGRRICEKERRFGRRRRKEGSGEGGRRKEDDEGRKQGEKERRKGGEKVVREYTSFHFFDIC
jgi:hypothetical protein